MIKSLFSLRAISLVVILSNLTFSGGGVTLLPKASARPNPTAYLQERDLFCEGGTKITGFPYGLFDWDEVPWGMPGDEFVRLFEEQIRQCKRDFRITPVRIETSTKHPLSGGWTRIEFKFEGENHTLSEIEIDNNGWVKDHLLERFGIPQNARFVDTRVSVGCIKVGIACRRIYEYGGKELDEGTWLLGNTKISLPWSLGITLEPAEPSLRTIERSSCDRFLIFEVC